ncbi:guanylate kinase [Campylobacter majalis]|uniref:guanylate kinase n=1 Tax=Campylobacter majalis TaxID=2790656 RepID=UPI003D69A720
MDGQILVISGPSGSGKSTLLTRLFQEERDLYFSISSTTRSPRDGEIDGVHYHFVSEDEFKNGIDNDEFLEWAKVHKNFYGTNLKPVLQALNDGKIVIFDIDVQGFNLAKQKFSNYITSLFLTTKSQSELKTRLQNRKSETEASIQNRLMNAVGEMQHIKEYDYFLINDDFQSCYDNLRSIIHVMRLKSSQIKLRETIDEWIDN